VKFAWVAPDDRSSDIIAYAIQIKTLSGTLVEDTTYCDGSQAAVVDARYCLVPMETLRAAPYSLEYGDLVVAIVGA
jgi:hypothetical protein